VEAARAVRADGRIAVYRRIAEFTTSDDYVATPRRLREVAGDLVELGEGRAVRRAQPADRRGHRGRARRRRWRRPRLVNVSTSSAESLGRHRRETR
jgi:hypothetical protein